MADQREMIQEEVPLRILRLPERNSKLSQPSLTGEAGINPESANSELKAKIKALQNHTQDRAERDAS